MPSSTIQIMGILNVTPDSFSDGGRYLQLDAALRHVATMVTAGADIIDVGGESTRPGAKPISVQMELDRVLPIIEKIRQEFAIPISVDTSQAQVMQAAIDVGVAMINDVRALQLPDALPVIANSQVKVCLMHSVGDPQTMQQNPQYQDVVIEVKDFLVQRLAICQNYGIAMDRICLDPGFGFGKNVKHNLLLLNHLDELLTLSCPLLVGLSRKSMIGHVLGTPVAERLPASLALACFALTKGARIFRVHDVAETLQALKMTQEVLHVSVAN